MAGCPSNTVGNELLSLNEFVCIRSSVFGKQVGLSIA
jgi:hypothetical protein